MDFLKSDVSLTEETKVECNEFLVASLSDIQLALVGGGVGETIVG